MFLPYGWFLAAVAARTAIIVVALVVAVRLFGRRNVGEMNMIDILMALMVGNAVQNALTTGSGSLGVGLVSAGVLLLIDRLLAKLFVRYPKTQKILLGEPRIIVRDGQRDRQMMRREGVIEDELMEAIREQGLSDISQVKLAVLEADGDISIIPKD